MPFDPSAHPALSDLGERLRELAGDKAYQAGRDYLGRGLVQQAAVAGTTAYAAVRGSTDYRVSVAFADEPKVACTCPAHRRSRFCKHVVAVCSALLERPGDFAETDPPPPAPARSKRRVKASGGRAGAAAPTAQRVVGLETVDRLLAELADGGLMSLGPDKAALLDGAGALVRSLKLRRLGNQILALRRAATEASAASPPGRGKQAGTPLAPHGFAELLVELYLARRAIGAHLEGRVALDPRLAEDLLGKTWREDELEPVADLELLEIGAERADDSEFRVDTAYLADLATGTVYAERQITPLALQARPKPRQRHRLLVESAGLYPGLVPRRIRLRRARPVPLDAADVRRLLDRADTMAAEPRRGLIERLEIPFGRPEVTVMFRPARLVWQGGRIGAVDGGGAFVELAWPDGWASELPDLLPRTGAYALFGLLELANAGLRLRCLSALSDGLRWGRGPIYPDA